MIVGTIGILMGNYNIIFYILYHLVSMGITIRISILGGLSKGKPSIVIHVSIVSL